MEDARSTRTPRLGVVEGTKPVGQGGGGNVRHRFLAFCRRARARDGARRRREMRARRDGAGDGFGIPQMWVFRGVSNTVVLD